MKAFQLCFLWIATVCSYVVASTVSTPEKVLIFYDPKVDDLTESADLSAGVINLLNVLDNGYEVHKRTYDEKTENEFSLFYQGEAKYDHLILLPSSKKSMAVKEGLRQANLLEFMNNNGNILVVGGTSSVLPEVIRGFLNDLGIYPSPKNFKYVDHFNAGLSAKNLIPGNNILKELSISEYNGAAALISNNEYLFPIVKSTSTGLTIDESAAHAEGDKTWTFGEQGFLAVSLQALNNARLTWVGSEDLLAETDLIKWTLQQKGVLRLKFVEHFKNDEPQNLNPTLYRIKDQAIYTIGVSEYSNGKWVPYEISEEENQLQIAFKMLDPYQRIDMVPLGPALSSPDIHTGDDIFIYLANFTVPDQHGIFTFDLDYKRSGLSFLSDQKVVTVRHLANDEFRRSWDIPNSWLYVASSALVTVAWFVFVVKYIYVTKVDSVKKDI